MDYENISTYARQRFHEAIVNDLSDEFDWEQLINLILEEDSPLQELFSEKTLQLADLAHAADRLFQSAKHLNDMEESKGEQ